MKWSAEINALSSLQFLSRVWQFNTFIFIFNFFLQTATFSPPFALLQTCFHLPSVDCLSIFSCFLRLPHHVRNVFKNKYKKCFYINWSTLRNQQARTEYTRRDWSEADWSEISRFVENCCCENSLICFHQVSPDNNSLCELFSEISEIFTFLSMWEIQMQWYNVVKPVGVWECLRSFKCSFAISAVHKSSISDMKSLGNIVDSNWEIFI